MSDPTSNTNLPTPISWTAAEAAAVLGAMRSVATANRTLGPVEIGLIEGARDHVFETTGDVDALASVSAEQLAGAVVDPSKRSTAVQFLVLMPYADMTVDEVEVSAVAGYAAALGVDTASLEDLHQVREHHIRRLIVDMGRRGIDVYADNAPHGRIRTILSAMHGEMGDKNMAARYDALSEYPVGSLGRAFHTFYRDRGFPLPGEHKSLMGDMLVTHDSAHILGGFNTDAAGEIDVAGFEAGMSGGEFGYEMLLEVLLDFHLGISLGATTVGIPTQTGALRPDTMMTGIRRGIDCTVDLIADWDFWSVADQQVLELRERYNVLGADALVPLPPPA